jgi:hypothetical protein
MRNLKDLAQGRNAQMYSQSKLREPSGGRGMGGGLHTAVNSKIVMLKCVFFLKKYLADF